jgi:hypothetical protein
LLSVSPRQHLNPKKMACASTSSGGGRGGGGGGYSSGDDKKVIRFFCSVKMFRLFYVGPCVRVQVQFLPTSFYFGTPFI